MNNNVLIENNIIYKGAQPCGEKDTIHVLHVPDHVSASRIDKYVSEQIADFSRTYLQYLIEASRVHVNALLVKKPSLMVKAGDRIEISLPPEKKRTYIPCNQDLIQLLFTHEHFFIINKPAGVLMHPASPYAQEPTVVDWLIAQFPELARVGSADRPAIVHRLDKETSGLVVVPRTNYAHKVLSDAFKDRNIQKTYLALVHGHPAKTGTISYPIGRSPSNRKKMMAFKDEAIYTASVSNLQKIHVPQTMRTATTHFAVKEYFGEHALVELKPVTGRTHQIRVHMLALGHPLVGDTLYGTSSRIIKRHALHAHVLSFTFDNVPYAFTADFPGDFLQAIEVLR